jgi:hypothetical protein
MGNAGPPRNDPEYVAYLERRIGILESRLPSTALLSPKFMTRAFAVMGHYFVAALVVGATTWAVFAIFTLFIAAVVSAGR